MSLRLYKKKRYTFWKVVSKILTSVVIIVVIFFVGVLIVSSLNKKVADIEPEITMTATAIPQSTAQQPEMDVIIRPEKDSLSPGASYKIHYTYSKCGHILEDERKIDNSWVDLDQEELQNKVDLEIISFKKDEVIVNRNYEEYCPNHYVLKYKDNELSVFKTKESSHAQEKLVSIMFDISSVDKQIYDKMAEGIAFDSLDEINAYIIDLDSPEI